MAGMPSFRSAAVDPEGASAEGHVSPNALDTLSDVLEVVRLTGALFFLVDARTPWVAEAPASTQLAAATHVPLPKDLSIAHCVALTSPLQAPIAEAVKAYEDAEPQLIGGLGTLSWPVST